MIQTDKINAQYNDFISKQNRDLISHDLISQAIELEKFITTIFPVKQQLDDFLQQAKNFDLLYKFKRNFVQRVALKIYNKPENNTLKDDDNFKKSSVLQLVRQVFEWLENPEQNADNLSRAARYCAYKVYYDSDSIIFQIPQKLDFDNLIDLGPSSYKPQIIDNTIISLDQSHYCIFCHKQSKDSCRTGIHEKSETKTNALGNKLIGCPLEQKISEMNLLYSQGNIIAALAVIMIDNPLVAATGDRICNDCMKSCIYQKQEPVNIPHIETQILKLVLNLPFGAEIYYLLSKWNPLIHPRTNDSLNTKKYLVVGLGPAGFAMSYYALRQGHNVTAVDGLNIEPLPDAFFQTIQNWPKLIDSLGPYKPQGFGGVAEYGITDRWDKYNLLLIRMLLEREKNFEMKGNFRLGKDITIKDAIEKDNYDYVALCMGAGRPKQIDISNMNANGVMSAFSFLASLHMNKKDFKYKMPVVIVGAGLTAMDCAMAALKYNHDPIQNVTIIYRNKMQTSPSYKENHHELQMTLNMGVKFLENTELESIQTDSSANIISINKTIPAGTLVYSIGTHINDKIFSTEAEAFKLYPEKIGIFGDMNPQYSGTVVKAIASVKDWLSSNNLL